jgi:RNA polymerase sigma-70 factor (ECF subfamily)
VSVFAVNDGYLTCVMPLPARVRDILLSVSHDASAPAKSIDVDHQDVAAARLGDGEAYSRIIRRHQTAIARQMMRFGRDRDTVQDLVHDCFVEAFLSLKNYRGDAPFDHWLAKIATRVGYRHWKTQSRDRARAEKLQSNSFPAAPQTAEVGDARELANYLLNQLSPRDRLAITLLYLEDKSVSEAAELAGWSQTMMKVQAFRARKKLRTLLERQGIHHE